MEKSLHLVMVLMVNWDMVINCLKFQSHMQSNGISQQKSFKFPVVKDTLHLFLVFAAICILHFWQELSSAVLF